MSRRAEKVARRKRRRAKELDLHRIRRKQHHDAALLLGVLRLAAMVDYVKAGCPQRKAADVTDA